MNSRGKELISQYVNISVTQLNKMTVDEIYNAIDQLSYYKQSELYALLKHLQDEKVTTFVY